MVIHVENIQKSFGKQEVLKGIDLDFFEGQIYSILGPNGSGKTTFMKSILGLVKPNNGKIMVGGSDGMKDHEYRSNIGYVPQIARFPENLKVNEVIDLVTSIRKQPSFPQEFVELFQIESFLNQRLKNLSGGTRQKVNLVLALMFKSDILILDEPTTGLDPINTIRLKELLLQLKSEGKTIIVTTHILHLAEELSDDIIFLLEGHVKYHGSTDRLLKLSHTKNLEEAIAAILQGEIDSEEETPVVNIYNRKKNA
ncbi:MAG: copper ABC transporter ATP-binding protein [Crocinitomicaceae bacterium]|nr:copper ABC transporter ATP-binding protein [Crocinitomicaceae bacterium]|tara:strand:+ start:9738 stop:10499 length:762 start_codon:yes stop_codon:yes gene_type:complete